MNDNNAQKTDNYGSLRGHNALPLLIHSEVNYVIEHAVVNALPHYEQPG